ncbi:hypothetical protein ACEWY4_019309 [Coilia grayii]|uniref:C2H2-type domain-containing protein n=1 Tax=Coilia grayii TaxID=363190 RepID=A0ABD1JGV4_9TELE
MIWNCKYCSVRCEKRAQLFKHYRLKHGSYTRTEPFPCLHKDCLWNLRDSFLQALDQISPNMLEVFKRKTGTIGQKLNQLVQETKTTAPTDIRCLVLHGLPVILGDDPGAFFRTSSDATNEEVYAETSVGILSMGYSDEGPHHPPSLNPSAVGIILEGTVVMTDIDNLPQAFYLLFGLIYALHLDYPRCMKNTFTFIQQVLLNIGKEKLGAKVQTLKNQLMM